MLSKRIVLFAILLLCSIMSIAGQAADSADGKASLIRVDFLVTGTGCPACLHRMERNFMKTPGVKKAAIMYMPPYAGAAIFDENKTSWVELSAAVTKGETAKLELETTREITKVPFVIIPDSAKLTQQDKDRLQTTGLFTEKN